jgi:hypothetical protein
MHGHLNVKNHPTVSVMCFLCGEVLAIYYGVMVTHLTTIVLLYHHPEDGRTTGRNILVNIFEPKMHYKIIKFKSVFCLFIHFINLINARNVGHISINLLRCAHETKSCPCVVTGK